MFGTECDEKTQVNFNAVASIKLLLSHGISSKPLTDSNITKTQEDWRTTIFPLSEFENSKNQIHLLNRYEEEMILLKVVWCPSRHFSGQSSTGRRASYNQAEVNTSATTGAAWTQISRTYTLGPICLRLWGNNVKFRSSTPCVTSLLWEKHNSD